MGDENSEGQLEVRFFGGFHQRALVDKHHIKDISTNIHSLQVYIKLFNLKGQVMSINLSRSREPVHGIKPVRN